MVIFPYLAIFFFCLLFPSKISNTLDFSSYFSLARTDSPRDCNSSNMLWIEFPQYSCLPGCSFHLPIRLLLESQELKSAFQTLAKTLDSSGNASPGDVIAPETFSSALSSVLTCYWLVVPSPTLKGCQPLGSAQALCFRNRWYFSLWSNWYTVAKLVNLHFPSSFKNLREKKKELSHSHMFLFGPRSHC